MGRNTNTVTTAAQYINNENQAMQAQTAQDAAVQQTATNGSPLVQAQLQQATNNGIRNATGVVASAKGINPAMAAREAGYNAANSQQQAANSAAQTQGQIQLGAQNELSNNLNNQYATDSGVYNSQSTLNQQNNQFNANLGINQAKAVSGSIGSMIGLAAAKGGMVPKMMAMGGGSSDATANNSANDTETKTDQVPLEGPIPAQVDPYAQISSFFNSLSGKDSPSSEAGKMLTSDDSMSDSIAPESETLDVQPQQSTPQGNSLQASFARGGKAKNKIPALVSPGETYLRPNQAKAVAKGKANPLNIGERIPGTPKVPGNSYANDTVHKNLESGGVVIPNSVMQSSDPAHNAYKFVQAVMAKQKFKGKKK